jgi:chromosomal replication initiator protein
VAEAPGTVYNPLYVLSEPGMGKTHLLHAICRRFAQLHPGEPIGYVSAPEFVAECANATNEGTRARFDAKYQRVSLLAFDDVDRLVGNEESQAAFYVAFNELHSQKRQIVVSGCCAPQDASELSEHLVSRLSWGLTVRLEAPDDRTKMAILRQESRAKGFDISDETLEYIARRVTGSARDVRYTLLRFKAFAALNEQPLTPATARAALSNDRAAR